MCVGNHRLGRCTSGVDAGSAKELAFDDCDFSASRCEAHCEGRAGLAGSYDERIEGVIHSQHRQSEYANGDTDEIFKKCRWKIATKGGRESGPNGSATEGTGEGSDEAEDQAEAEGVSDSSDRGPRK